MKTDPRRFAPLGLVLSLLALLSFLIVLIIKGLENVKVITLADTKILDQGIWICIAVFVIGLAATALLDPEGTRKFFLGRQVQYGSNSFIMLAAFIGVVVFVNLIVYNYQKDNPPIDLTENQQNSLAPETINTLAALPEPVNIRAYYSSRMSKDEIQKLLDNFKRNSKGNLTYEFRDLYQDPYSAQQDGISHDGALVLYMGERKETSTLATEQDIDAALLRLINPESRTVYFVTGHGERDTENVGEASLTQVKAALQNKNYTVKLLNLGAQAKVPDDAKLVVVAGPQQLFPAGQVTILDEYMQKGGAVIVMEDPQPLTEMGTGTDPLAEMLATKYNITLENDVIINTDAPNNVLIVYTDVQNYATHPITENLRSVDTIFFTARSIKTAESPEGVNMTELAKTYATSQVWGETDFQSLKKDQQVIFDPSVDLQAPLTLAVARENFASKGRLVVFGDSEFASDQLYQNGYGDILINAVDWATSQENLITLTPKNNITRSYVPPTTPVLIGLFLLSLCVIPLVVVIAGVVAWYSRRRKG